MQDPEQSDTITGGLIDLLRGRARRMRWTAYGFIVAIIGVILAAIVLYQYVPTLVTAESLAREEARLEALQKRLEKLDEDILQGEQSRAALKADIIERIRQQETRIFDPVQRVEGTLRSVHFIDQAVGWAVGEGGTILATGDGGRTWQAQQSGTGERLYAVQFVDQAVGWAVGRSGAILATSDGGQTWQAQKSPTGVNLWSVQFLDQAVGWAVGYGGIILATTDGGQNWQAQRAPIDEHLHSVQFIDQANGWAVGNSGTILATTDGGQNWQAQEAPTSEDLRSVQFVN
ncbi:MAG: hypothetical protein IID49_13065, partial [Proteobacteria bacterium]|nr:hypothetical protein [Pseudomonadota bacterium]